ncbi:unnamed protein product [Cylindrotheca closterium]|uniref:Orc1-like AAA ATPase domain-containing protein n=1 Tax=Cylindrotheca closterium TaxID=2856 RepID=A0AAD2CLY7_9STRA|nr:unnamed protein product [Cylindrotheca closterium]
MDLCNDSGIGERISEIIVDTNDKLDDHSRFADSDALLSESADAWIVKNNSRELSSGALMAEMKTSELRKLKHSEPHLIADEIIPEEEIRKLEFESIGLINREYQISCLKTCLNRMLGGSPEINNEETKEVEESSKKELVFLKGLSGSGKSAVANTLESDVLRYTSGMFVVGKFDQTTSDKPYSGVAKAFGVICERIGQMPDDVKKIEAEILETFGNDVEELIDLIPQLKYIIKEYPTSAISDTEDHSLESGQERLRFAFRALTRVFSAVFSPLVLVLDDLQWSDISSLQILDYLITDTQNPNPLMVIGCYRSDKVDENSVLSNKILALKRKRNTCSFNMTELKMDAFTADDIFGLIQSRMRADHDAKTKRLATLCVKRTMGNPYFVLEFLKMLKFEGLLTFDAEGHNWMWDLSQIKEVTMSTANVVVLLQRKIQKMPSQVQRLLQYAACIGSSFSLPTLELVWKKSSIINNQESLEPFETLIATAEENFFIEKYDSNHYRWVHDKVQEAALLLKLRSKAAFQLDVGSSLYYCLDEKTLEEELFNVADIINSGNVNKRPEFARLNLRAAEKAKGVFAIQSAANYAAKGIELLQEGTMSTNRVLTLKLYTIGAEMELALGNGEQAEMYSKEILSRDDYSTVEKIPLKIASVRKLSVVDSNFRQSIEVGLELLREMGHPLVRSRRMLTVQAIAALKITVQRVKTAPAAKDLHKTFSLATDQKHKMCILLLGNMCFSTYQTKETILHILCVCRLVQMTLDHGIAPDSGPGFAGLGLMAAHVHGDFETGYEIAERGLAIQKIAGKYREGATVFTAYSFPLAWKLRLEAVLKPLSEGYASSMRVGDPTHAMWTLISRHIWIPYMIGRPLSDIMKELPLIQSQMEELSKYEQLVIVKVFWQMVLNMRSNSPHAHKLEGHIFTRNEYDEGKSLQVGTVHFAEGELLVFFKPEEAADRAIRHAKTFSKLCPCMCVGMIETFHRGVALYIMARKTKRRKYKSHASKIRKTIKKWLEAGNPNVEHYDLLLDAEHAALNKSSYDRAEKLYLEAIELASRMGYLHHAGLFNERYADFLSHERKDLEESVHFLNEAIRFYEQWGATKKVKMLTNSSKGG